MNVVIFHHNTQGLANDATVLKNCLNFSPSYKISIYTYDERYLYTDEPLDFTLTPDPDIVIFLEHIHPQLVRHGVRFTFVPNLEWITQSDVKLCKEHCMDICAKTPHSYERLCEFFPAERVFFTGWTSIDRQIERSVETEAADVKEHAALQCLHLKGVSKYKGTQQILDIWCNHPEWPILHIVGWSDGNSNGNIRLPHVVNVAPNVLLYQYKMDEDALKRLMNTCDIHICPSFSEGFGHYINEGLSTGAIVVTTNGFPMNELVRPEYGFLIPVSETSNVRMGFGYTFTDQSFEDTISKIGKYASRFKDMSRRSRLSFEESRDRFTKTMRQVIEKSN